MCDIISPTTCRPCACGCGKLANLGKPFMETVEQRARRIDALNATILRSLKSADTYQCNLCRVSPDIFEQAADISEYRALRDEAEAQLFALTRWSTEQDPINPSFERSALEYEDSQIVDISSRRSVDVTATTGGNHHDNCQEWPKYGIIAADRWQIGHRSGVSSQEHPMARQKSANSTSNKVSPPKTRRDKDPVVCSCGCGATTAGGDWLPGHDARHKSALLKRHDAGDATATQELVGRGWYTASQLENRNTKSGATTERRLARLRSRLERAEAQQAKSAAEVESLRTEIAGLGAVDQAA